MPGFKELERILNEECEQAERVKYIELAYNTREEVLLLMRVADRLRINAQMLNHQQTTIVRYPCPHYVYIRIWTPGPPHFLGPFWDEVERIKKFGEVPEVQGPPARILEI